AQAVGGPRAPGPGDRALVAGGRTEAARLVEEPLELLPRRRGPRVGAQGGHGLVGSQVAGCEQLGPRPLLGAELPQAQLAPVGETDQEARALVAQRGALSEEL